jgi:hypothetical protein
MQIPIDFWNISLWFAVTGITLLIIAQIAFSYEGDATLLIDQKRLRTTAVIMGILFLATMAIRIYEIAVSA